MKEEKKENGDGETNTDEVEGEQGEKRPRLDDSAEDKPVSEQNGTKESESVGAAEDDDVQEIKVDVPIIELNDEEIKVKADPVVVEPVKESQPATPATKTTPTRGGRGGARGRGGVARRGRSSR